MKDKLLYFTSGLLALSLFALYKAKADVQTQVVEKVVEKQVPVEKIVYKTKIKKVYIKVPIKDEVVHTCEYPEPKIIKETIHETEYIYPDLRASVSALIGVGRVDTGKMGGAYGLHIQGYLNPIVSVGVYGLTNMTTGLSLGVTF